VDHSGIEQVKDGNLHGLEASTMFDEAIRDLHDLSQLTCRANDRPWTEAPLDIGMS
jgi:hypothetical protein